MLSIIIIIIHASITCAHSVVVLNQRRWQSLGRQQLHEVFCPSRGNLGTAEAKCLPYCSPLHSNMKGQNVTSTTFFVKCIFRKKSDRSWEWGQWVPVCEKRSGRGAGSEASGLCVRCQDSGTPSAPMLNITIISQLTSNNFTYWIFNCPHHKIQLSISTFSVSQIIL